jgi:hypothetical protein
LKCDLAAAAGQTCWAGARRGDRAGIAEDGRVFDDVGQLADVARPNVLLQGRDRVVGQELVVGPRVGPKPPQQVPRKLRNVADPLAQRRQRDHEGVDAKHQVFAEHLSLSDLDGEADLKFHTDFRRRYARILDGWLDCPSQAVLGERFEPLPLFKA